MTSPQPLERPALACMTCLGVHSQDRVLVVSNQPNRRIAEALVEAALGRTAGPRHDSRGRIARWLWAASAATSHRSAPRSNCQRRREAADWLLTTLDAGAGGNGRTIAELGIGVNPGATVTGTVILDEKARGTAHVAFGTNISFGGANAAAVHIDAVLCRPTVCLDDATLIRDGEPQFGDEN